MADEALKNIKLEMAWNDVYNQDYKKVKRENKKLRARIEKLRVVVQEYMRIVGGTPKAAQNMKDMNARLSAASLGHVPVKIEPED